MRMNVLGAAIAMSLALCASAFASNGPEGLWRMANGASIRIAQCGQAMCGRIVEPAGQGDNAPVADQMVVRNLRPSDSGGWRGQVWAARINNWTDVSVRRQSAQLILRACVAFTCRDQTWTSLEE